MKKTVGLGDLIVKAYGPNYNVLSDGDIRTLSGTPAHRPYLLYVMGDEDHFGLDKTKMVWDHWYADQQAAFNTSPTQAPKQRKWFRVVERACHASGAVDEYTVFEWDGFWPLVDEFIDLTLHSSHSESSSF